MIRKPFQIRSPLDEGHDLIRGDVRFAEGPAPRTAVVVVHGFKGFKDWAFFPWLAEQLARRGHAVVSFNFSCNGIGETPEEFTELEAFARNTHSRELAEIDHVMDLVTDSDLLPRQPDRVGLLGHSRGGGAAVIQAAEDVRVEALVTWAAIANFDRWAPETIAAWREDGRVHVLNGRTGQHMPIGLGLLEDFEAHRERLDVTAAAGRVNAPWLIVHGMEDTTVRFDDAEVLARASGRARLIGVENAGHTFEARHPFEAVPDPLQEAFDVTAAHFARHLGGD